MAVVPPIPTDRLRGAFLAMVRAVVPQLLFFGTYEAKVVTSSAPSAVQSQLGGVTWVVSAAFTDVAIAKVLPPLANLTMWPGPVWGYSQPAPGSLVRVSFVNGDPSKPAIVGLDPSTPPTPATPVCIGGPVAATQFLSTAAVTAALVTFSGALSTASSVAQVAAAGAALALSLAAPGTITLNTKAA